MIQQKIKGSRPDRVRAIAVPAPRHSAQPEPVFPVSALRASVDFRGPSRAFVSLTRNPDLAERPPVRFEPTVKGENDVVI